MPQIQINDICLYFELHGPEEAPLLVLNNGVIMNAATSWVFQTQALSSSYQLLQYDCRGQGHSDHPEGPYSMELHADDLSALLEALNFEGAHIAGISYGGEVAQAFALKYPHKTLSLMLIDTVSEVHMELRLVIESWLDALRTRDSLAFFNATIPWNFSPQFVRQNPALLEDAKKRYESIDFDALIQLCNCFLEADFTNRLGEIEAPTCIMVGELDLLKGIEYAKIMKAEIPHAEFHVLMGSGHASCWEAPQEFNTTILGFLSKYA